MWLTVIILFLFFEIFLREQGMDVSLFKELSAAHPEAVVTLNVQYRMNESIMSLANSLVYNNSMTCGNSSMTDSCLDLPKYREMTSQLGSGKYLEFFRLRIL